MLSHTLMSCTLWFLQITSSHRYANVMQISDSIFSSEQDVTRYMYMFVCYNNCIEVFVTKINVIECCRCG